ncbi:MAG: FlgD immunoglobulin-like domain containing protein [candidate division WOR-3 bacterium]
MPVGFYANGIERNYPPYQFTPSLCVSGSKVYAVWQDRISWGEYSSVVAKRSVNNGETWSDPVVIGGQEPAGGEPEMNPSCSAEGDVLYVVWADRSDGDSEIYYGKLDAWPSATGEGAQGYDNGLALPIEVKVINGYGPAPVRIHLKIKESASLKAEIYDTAGRLVGVLADGLFTAGAHELIWDGTGQHGEQVNDGVYFVSLSTGKGAASAKILVLK